MPEGAPACGPGRCTTAQASAPPEAQTGGLALNTGPRMQIAVLFLRLCLGEPSAAWAREMPDWGQNNYASLHPNLIPFPCSWNSGRCSWSQAFIPWDPSPAPQVARRKGKILTLKIQGMFILNVTMALEEEVGGKENRS